MKSFRLVSLLLALTLLVGAMGTVLAQDDTFMGMTAADLFPDAVSDVERDTAFAALVDADLPDATGQFAGETLTVGVLGQGARGGISGPLYFWRPAFEAATGATLEIVEIPFAQLQTVIPADFLTEQYTYDVIITGSWFYGDMVSNGWIQPVDPFIGQEGFPDYDPTVVAQPLLDLMSWQGQMYGTLNDGDAQLLYFRKDILEDPEWQAAYEAEVGSPMPYPIATWQDLLAITTFFNGKDWNDDGDPDDGISLHLRSGGQGFFHFMSLSAGFAITPGEGDDVRAVSKYDNVYWFDPDDMTPLINGPGHVAALEYLQALAATGQEAQFGWELGEAWNNFLTGNAIATFSWGDVGSLSQKPETSTIMGTLGAGRIPCSTTWYDREAGEMVTDEENPNCVGNTTGGSWHPIMSAYTDSPELAYYFMAMQANPVINFWNVTAGWTGVDPSSLIHLFPPDGSADVAQYTQYGFNESDATEYITAYGANLFSMPITQTYIRIPGTPEYWTILDTRLSEAMTGQQTAQDALDLVAQEWDAVTDDIGRDSQLAIYQESIGYTPGM
ncbi:MAG: extracellular solute-binding protein [Burkholderiales bacterium]|nr:extracellular solute-binding protein [Anaerolineae bacterium]